MKAALVIDWTDLAGSPDVRHLEVASVITRIAEAAREDALGTHAALESLRVYGTPADLQGADKQQLWINSAFDIRIAATSSASRDQIAADCLEYIRDRGYEYIIVVTGSRDYRQLAKLVREKGGRLLVWSASVTVASGEVKPLLPLLIQMTTDATSPVFQTSPGTSGVAKLLRRELTDRIAAQLLPEARQLSREATVAPAFDRLLSLLAKDAFAPTTILAWTDETRHWNGSYTVAERLARSLGCTVAEATVREEGESRRILNIPPLTAGAHVLIVDDAAFSGLTLDMLRAACVNAQPGVQVKTAVLSALDPPVAAVDFHAATHHGKDVLFPWGWARTVDQFYDLLRELGTRDRRWMPRAAHGACAVTHLTAGELASVSLVTALSDKDESLSFGARESDDLLYVVTGQIRVSIEGTTGVFEESEFLFIPRVVLYSLVMPPSSQALRVGLSNAKT